MLNIEILLTIKLHQQLFVDPKRITLLKQIQQCGSINQAAKNAHISYKSAWDHLAMMNEISPKPLLERNTGGKNGGGTVLTPYALRLLKLYDLLEQIQMQTFSVLQDEQISLDSLLIAMAQCSLQSSARNQFFGKVEEISQQNGICQVSVMIANFPQNLTACITPASASKLQLGYGKEVMLMIKAPWVHIHPQEPKQINQFPAKIIALNSNEHYQEATLQIADNVECYATFTHLSLQVNQSVWITIDPNQIVLLTL